MDKIRRKMDEIWGCTKHLFYFHLRLRINVTYYIPRSILSQNMTKTEKASYQRPFNFHCGIYHTVNLRDAEHTDI